MKNIVQKVALLVVFFTLPFIGKCQSSLDKKDTVAVKSKDIKPMSAQTASALIKGKEDTTTIKARAIPLNSQPNREEVINRQQNSNKTKFLSPVSSSKTDSTAGKK